MSGTFGSLSTALTALQFNRVAMDVASSNVANSTTEGYVRRRVIAETIGAPAVPALWSRYDGAGEGVRSTGLGRMVDAFLDMRARREHASQSYLDTRRLSLERLEGGVGEPGDTGVAAALASFRQSWHDLSNNPGGPAMRGQVLARANALAEAIRIQAANVEAEAGDQRNRLVATMVEVNTVASDLAAVNDSVAAAQLSGTDAAALLDRRDQLALRLSELVGATATVRPDGGFDVTVGGVPLVTGNVAGTLDIATGVTPTGGADGNPVTFEVNPGGTSVPAVLRGEVGALTDLLNTTLPAYGAGLDAVAQSLADDVNALHQSGYDLGGTAGVAVFTYDPADPAGSLAVAFTDSNLVAASGLPGGNLDGSVAAQLGGALDAEQAYQQLVNGLGTEVASSQRLAANQQALTAQVDGSREQLSGVNLDEEMTLLLAHQRAYEAAARVMSTVDTVLDTLINRTGLVR